jgi:hypothetical protein
VAIDVTASGMVMVVSPLQAKKHIAEIVVNVRGSEIAESRPQLENVLFDKLVKPLGRVTVVSLEQLLKALSKIAETESGIAITRRAVQPLNALLSMTKFDVAGKFTWARFEHPEKQDEGML